MKTIEIRFVIDSSKNHDKIKYYIQQKTWLGWKYLKHLYQNSRFETPVYKKYSYDDSDKLLEIVLDSHLQTTKRFVTIIEHPSLTIY